MNSASSSRAVRRTQRWRTAPARRLKRCIDVALEFTSALSVVGASVAFRQEGFGGNARMPVITCIEDLRRLAQKRVPRMFYDYADSGSWSETTYRANETDFMNIKLRQRVAINVESRNLRT